MSTAASDQMCVEKRDGRRVEVSFDAILRRLKALGAMEREITVNYGKIVLKIIDQMHDGIPTSSIDELAAEQCAAMSTTHPDYGVLAGRIIVSNNHKNTQPLFSTSVRKLHEFRDVHGKHTPLVSDTLREIVEQHGDALDSWIDEALDYDIDYFGFKTLERAYLLKINGAIVERPQHLWLRVSLGIHGYDFTAARETYNLLATKKLMHATPTLFNAGTPRPQLSSCYLVAMESDSITGIYNTVKECAEISKWAGGIGCHIHNVRAMGSHIRGTNGSSNGLVPMLRVFNSTARYVDQGGGKRNGSIAVYLEPWHADIESFLNLKKNHGDEEARARDLFYALWIPDLFMKRVRDDGPWHLFCPDVCPGLSEAYGEAFEELYNSYVDRGMSAATVAARDLWLKILDSQMETGTPYLLYKDAANRKSNQKNLGTIKSSNLCCEIIEYSDENETAVCNLGSLGLPTFVKGDQFDYHELHRVAEVLTRNLNRVIDVNYYPTEKARRSNTRHRPIGIGVQGLADVFALMGVPYDSLEARRVNVLIFETIYHAALTASHALALERKSEMIAASLHTGAEVDGHCGSYSTFSGSPMSEGILQFDMWTDGAGDMWNESESRYNWDELRQKIRTDGLRNSLLVAPMPTASTAQILGNTECFEPFTSNLYTRRTMAGDFVQVNEHLVRELLERGLWTDAIKDELVRRRGSVKDMDDIPLDVRSRYKTAWEMPMKHLIDMAADRGRFVCQSQSLNLWKEDPDYRVLTSMHMYAWNKGLKTGIYYLRRKPRANAQQFTIEPNQPCESCSG